MFVTLPVDARQREWMNDRAMNKGMSYSQWMHKWVTDSRRRLRKIKGKKKELNEWEKEGKTDE